MTPDEIEKELKPEWLDHSSYSRNEYGNIPPTTWKLDNIFCFKILITRHIRFPNTWVLLCPTLDFDLFDLKKDDVKEAQQKALKEILKALQERIKYFQDVSYMLLNTK